MRRSFEDALAHARTFERAMGRLLQSRGWWLLNACDYAGGEKAPSLARSDEALITPDLLSWRGAESRWVEVKWKQRADQFRNGPWLVTGINRRHWNQYRKVQAETKTPVWLVFVHEDEGEIRGATIDDLSRRPMWSHESPKMGGMVFFRYLEIPRWAPLSVLPVPA